MVWRLGIACLAVAIAAPAAAQESRQQRFEQSSAALGAGRWAEALTGFEALETQIKGGKSLGLVLVRKGEALLEVGRRVEARVAIERGLALLPTSDASLTEDRLISHLHLGRIAEGDLDYAAAQAQYRLAEPLAADPLAKGRVLRGLIQTSMFDDAPTALAAADRVIASVSAQAPDRKTLIAQLRSLKGRVLLNLKRYKEAQTELGWATKALGGLTSKVDAADLTARADMSLALLLDGEEEKAREYLAYTGAGRLRQDFGYGAQMKPPVCGENGLEPGDVAVVEFSIRDNGAIGHATPVYASRQGASATAFARAVQGWSWQPDEVKAIPPLLRALTRVELRCSTAAARPETLQLLRSDVVAWFAEKNLPEPEVGEGSDAERLQPLRQELARREGAGGAGLLPVLVALGENEVVAPADRVGYLRRALSAARGASAPPIVEAYLKLRLATAEEHGRDIDFQPLLADAALAANPRSAAAVRLLGAGQLAARERREDAKRLLQQVKDMPGLSAPDPLRVAALLRLSSLELATGNDQGARSAFAATGLTGQQCALIDPGPAKASGRASSNDFPDEALRWGFEGFVTVEHDIRADGRPANARPTVAYPPFVFGKAATRMIERFEWDPSYRPDGSIGCGGKVQRIAFRLP